MDWAEGYVSDIDYTFGYYNELNPTRVASILINSGIRPPKIENACELGFGQGVSIGIHGAASDIKWWGTDFNPNQAVFARGLVNSYQGNTQIFDDAFADFFNRQDLPDFDYIGLHGIWTWISDENRNLIVDFVRRKLRYGGVLYVSYNTLPGWAAHAPLRQLMTQHAASMGAPGAPLVEKIRTSLDFTEKVLGTNAAFTRAVPSVTGRLSGIKNQNPNYIAHEYFNKDWRPMYFNEMADLLAPAKLSFAGSAHYLDHVDGVNFLPEQIKLLADISDVTLRNTVRDFLVNQQFRRDYWIKGAQRLSTTERLFALRESKVILVGLAAKFSFKATGAQGEASLSEAIYKPVLDILADYEVHSLGELYAKLGESHTFEQIVETVLIIAGTGFLQFVRTDGDAKTVRQRAHQFNRYLCDRSRWSADVAFLVSPVTGGGIAVNRFSQLFALAVMSGRKTDKEMGAFVWAIISTLGQKIVKAGAVLESAEENEAELARQAGEFLAHEFPVMKALQIL